MKHLRIIIIGGVVLLFVLSAIVSVLERTNGGCYTVAIKQKVEGQCQFQYSNKPITEVPAKCAKYFK